MAVLKVLIVGGGIAGNALAFWLSKQHHDVTVIEKHPEMRASGLQVDLRGHGVAVMKLMGLEPAFRAKQVHEQGLRIVDSNDKQWAYFPANKSGKGLQSFTTDAEIMRGDLCHLTYEATKARAQYRFGTSIQSYQEDAHGITVHFTDGQIERYDLVVGADGMWSRTRRLVFGPDTPDTFRPLDNVYAAYFTIPQPIRADEKYMATVYLGAGRRSVMTRRHTPHKLQVYLGFSSDSGQLEETRRGDIDEEKRAFKEFYTGAGWKVEELLQGMQESEDFYCERMALVTPPIWSKGRVTLVGDAAWCPTAMTGMGTTAGIVGAYILAGEISRHCKLSSKETDDSEGLGSALRAYENTFRPFMTQVQRGVSGDMYSKMPSSQLGIFILNVLLWLVAISRLNIIGEWMLREKVDGWVLPEYEDMCWTGGANETKTSDQSIKSHSDKDIC